MEEIEKVTKNGIPILVRFTNLDVINDNEDNFPNSIDDIDKFNSLSGDIDIKFEEIKSPSLPKK